MSQPFVKEDVLYTYRRNLAITMRRNGFRFLPILRDPSLAEPAYRKCDYQISIDVENRKVNIVLTV